MKKYLSILLASIGFSILGSFFIANAQYITPNLWVINGASSTITPIQSSLKVPCANIVGGCSGGSSSGTAFYLNGVLYITSSSVNFQQGSNITITSSTVAGVPTFTITGVAASGTVTQIVGVSPIVVTQVGANATATCPTCIATNTGDWAGTWQTFSPAHFLTVAITSINGDTSAAQKITSTGCITTSTSAGITTIGSTCITTSTFNLTGTAWNITGWNNAGTSLLPTSTIYMQSSTGNIGIFTTSPASRLTVAQSSTGDEAEGLLIDGSLNGATSNADIELNAASSSATEANVDFTKGGVDQWQIGIQNNGTNDFELWDGSNNPAFTINNSTLDAAFGTSTASAELTIQNEAGSVSPTLNVLNASGTTQLNVANNGDVSVGTSSDKGLLGVVNASGTVALSVSTTTNVTSSFVSLNVKGNPSSTATITPVSIFQILASGHINATGTTPTMGTCGSSPSVIGTDSMGTITVGSGVVTSCTMNFQIPYESSNLQCVESDNSTAVTGDISAITTSSVTFSFSATLGGGKVSYFCGMNL